MSLENQLAKNMIRFGVKNLSEQSNQKLTRLNNKLLGEQLIKFKKGRRRSFNWSWGKDAEGSIPFENYQKNLVNKDPATWDAYLKANEGKFVKLLDSDSIANWQELKTDEANKGYAVAAIEQFNESYPKFKWQHAYCDTEEAIEEKILQLPKPKKTTPAVDFNGISAPSIEFPSQGMGSNFFVDNLFEPTAEFAAAVTADIIEPLLEKAATMINHPKTTEASVKYPKFHLDMLRVVTSCSRFRNTGDAKDMTFLELAEARANAAKDYILKRLNDLGPGIVTVDDESDIEIKFDGENGDGSSGPNPLAPYQVPRDDRGRAGMMKEIWSEVTAAARRDNWGAPLADKAQYNNFKYCRAGIGLSANLAWMPKPDGEPGDEEPDYEVIVIPVPTKNYGVYFFSEAKDYGFGFRLPKIKFGKIRIRKPRWFSKFIDWLTPPRKQKNITKCFTNW